MLVLSSCFPVDLLQRPLYLHLFIVAKPWGLLASCFITLFFSEGQELRLAFKATAMLFGCTSEWTFLNQPNIVPTVGRDCQDHLDHLLGGSYPVSAAPGSRECAFRMTLNCTQHTALARSVWNHTLCNDMQSMAGVSSEHSCPQYTSNAERSTLGLTHLHWSRLQLQEKWQKKVEKRFWEAPLDV